MVKDSLHNQMVQHFKYLEVPNRKNILILVHLIYLHKVVSTVLLSANCVTPRIGMFYEIPYNYSIHAIPSVNMDHDGWFTPIARFSHLCRLSKSNKKILFFYGYNSHFDINAIYLMSSTCVHTFTPKSGESIIINQMTMVQTSISRHCTTDRRLFVTKIL